MEKSTVQADIQLLDNYINEFSLQEFEKIQEDKELELGINMGFQIVNIEMENRIGQIEVAYDINVKDDSKEVAKIKLKMNALFQATEKISQKKFEEMLKLNGTATLSHLCRAYIQCITALSGMPTIVMPMINFCEFFKNAKQEKNENKKVAKTD